MRLLYDVDAVGVSDDEIVDDTSERVTFKLLDSVNDPEDDAEHVGVGVGVDVRERDPFDCDTVQETDHKCDTVEFAVTVADRWIADGDRETEQHDNERLVVTDE